MQIKNLTINDKIELFNLLVIGLKLKIVTPKTAWKLLYPILKDYKKSIQEAGVKAVKKDGVVVLESLAGKIIRKEMWSDDFLYFNKEFFEEEVPLEIGDLYLSKDFSIIGEVVANFNLKLVDIYGEKEAIENYLTFLNKVKEEFLSFVNKKGEIKGEKIIDFLKELKGLFEAVKCDKIS
ncbi:MAG: hypothetical protein LWW95_08150 [Candidatus Desulfofervidus auxilii]|nr:hypothetical protein [Candidatus Desulfofervidus auxilii]